MKTRNVDALVVGGGSAGLAAALRLREGGASVAIMEREPYLGGILLQCIHTGFGLHEFGEDLTGPEYARRFVAPVQEAGIPAYLDATVTEIGREPHDGRGTHSVTALSTTQGVVRFSTRAVILAMGCRERNRGNVAIAGTRPAGVFTAGLAQRLVNVEGCVPGRSVVIIGSGDIGLIMARRLTLVGCRVLAVVEIQAYPSGNARNIAQCLNDFSIPLYLGHVVTRIEGRDRVEAVRVAPRDGTGIAADKEFRIPCDTVLLSVGLIPENELSRAAGVSLNEGTGGPWVDADYMTGVPGIFACGNVLHVHDLVDFVTEEARQCAAQAARYLAGEPREEMLPVSAGANVRSIVPNACAPGRRTVFMLRSLVVKNDARLIVSVGGQEVRTKRLPHVQPSEMIRAPLEPGEIPAAPARGGREAPPTVEVSIR
ncbi:MAG TPA: FAD-dependent oxidoreductase [Spirochaetia bacterium]|nr:FAD-dependent oxidoreductase [Spirochaetia bacterium]